MCGLQWDPDFFTSLEDSHDILVDNAELLNFEHYGKEIGSEIGDGIGLHRDEVAATSQLPQESDTGLPARAQTLTECLADWIRDSADDIASKIIAFSASTVTPPVLQSSGAQLTSIVTSLVDNNTTLPGTPYTRNVLQSQTFSSSLDSREEAMVGDNHYIVPTGLSVTRSERLNCTEPSCHVLFTSKRDRQRHVNTVHRGQTVKCRYCSKTFKDRRDNMARHVKKYCKASMTDRLLPATTSHP